jgi:glycosyltransferase involved in cell wall biosynthesis
MDSGTLITFIIPTIGRPTLQRTLDSIRASSNPSWEAIVMFDGVDPTLESGDERIRVYRMDKVGVRNFAARVRNHAIAKARTPWVGFVDDDDTITPTYVSDFVDHLACNPDVIIFRMRDRGRVLPPPDATRFVINKVGISFCLKTKLFREQGVWFLPGPAEDFHLLHRLRLLGKDIFLSPHINYHVRPVL